MDQNKKILIGIFALVIFVAVLAYMKKQKEEGDKPKDEEEKEPCKMLSWEEFEIQKSDWYWWLRRSTEAKMEEAYQKYKQAKDGTKRHPSYHRWAENKMKELNLCQEDI